MTKQDIVKKVLAELKAKGLLNEGAIKKYVAKKKLNEEIPMRGGGGNYEIGKTRSGKKVRANTHPDKYKNFTKEDHEDASAAHEKDASPFKKKDKEQSSETKAMYDTRMKYAFAHKKAATTLKEGFPKPGNMRDLSDVAVELLNMNGGSLEGVDETLLAAQAKQIEPSLTDTQARQAVSMAFQFEANP